MLARCTSRLLSVVLLFFSMLMVTAAAQNRTDDSASDAYKQAVDELLSQGRGNPLEIFLEDHPNSPLKKDALELLIWSYGQSDRLDKAASAAHSLARIDPANAAALAVLAESADEMSRMGAQRGEDQNQARTLATRGLLALANFTTPSGISPTLFNAMQREIKATLDSVLGMAALRSKDYLTAQMHLREAVNATPEDVERMYSLALSYLLATPPDNSDGMWFLARVSNLAPAGQLARQADSYGRNVSRSLYGSESRWEDLLRQTQFASFPDDLSTAPPQPAHDPLSSPASTTGNAIREAGHKSALLKIRAELLDGSQMSRPVPLMDISVRRLDSNAEPYSRTVATDNSGTIEMTLPAGRYELVTPQGASSGQQWFTWNLEIPATDPKNYIELTNQNATAVNLGSSGLRSLETARVPQATPVFLGIVVDNSAAMAGRLNLVKNGLLASVGQLRPGEQALIVADGGRPRITQDLTSNAALLQASISHMAPNGRAALYDGIIIAANQLRQHAGHGIIGLLIVGDGEDAASRSTLKQAQDALRSIHAAAYCVGTHADNAKAHDTLTLLASDTGGKALFPRLPNLAIIAQRMIGDVQRGRMVSAPDPAPGLADTATRTVAQKSLRGYPAVTVKEFVVEDSPDTAEFRAGDEALLQKVIIGRLRKYTNFRQVVDAGENGLSVREASQAGDRLTLAGIVVGYNSGGRIRRDLIGFLGGVMSLTVRFVFRDAQSGEEVFRTELTSTGGPVFFGGGTEEMRSQAMLRLADSLIKQISGLQANARK